MALTREAILEYLTVKQGIDAGQLESDDTQLFSSGLMDSFSMVDLIQFIEEAGGFKMGAGDVNLDNLDSVSRILSYAQVQVA